MTIDTLQYNALLALLEKSAAERDLARALRRPPGRPYREKTMTAAAIRRVTEQYKKLVDEVNTRSGFLAERMETVHAKFDTAIQRHAQVVNDMSVSIDEIEDLTNQLSNGGPPLEPSSPPHADSNGVAVNNK